MPDRTPWGKGKKKTLFNVKVTQILESGAGRVRVVWDDGRWSDIKGMVYEPTLPSQSTSKDE